MQLIAAIYTTHPQRPPGLTLIQDCLKACISSSSCCVACSDACLGEAHVADLVCCIRTCLDCSDVCAATARVVARLTQASPMLVEVQLTACAEACRVCADECERFGSMHDYCRACAEACRICESACRALMHGAAPH